MMKKLTLILALVGVIFSSSIAMAENGQVIHAQVNGMVCDFCARSLEILFNKQEAVERLEVDLTEKRVSVYLKANADMDDEVVTKLITDAGYEVAKITRPE